MKRGKILLNGLSHFEEAVLTVTFSIMTVVCFAQVITRYCFHYSLPWSEELLRALFVWSSCMGISWGMKTRSHLGVDAVVKCFPAKVRKILAILTYAILIAFCILVIYYSIYVTMKQFATNQVTIAMRLPVGYISMSLPIGFSLTIIRALQVLYEDVLNGAEKTEEKISIPEGLL